MAQDLSICGNIKNETLTIPSYRFIVADKYGKQFPNLRIKGEVLITEHKWGHTYNDWNWEQIDHRTPIAVTFDANEGGYISTPLPNIKVATQKHFLKPHCLERIESFSFEFLLGDEKLTPKGGYGGLFTFSFENKKLDKLLLPDSNKVIKITLKNWDGTRAL